MSWSKCDAWIYFAYDYFLLADDEQGIRPEKQKIDPVGQPTLAVDTISVADDISELVATPGNG